MPHRACELEGCYESASWREHPLGSCLVVSGVTHHFQGVAQYTFVGVTSQR